MAANTPEEALAEARRRVAHARATNLEILDLGDLPLQTLPEFEEMPGLRVLALGDSQPVVRSETLAWQLQQWRTGFQSTDLGPLSPLSNLHTLSLSGCQLVSDVSSLSLLANLRELHLGHTKASDLGPLAGLRGLRTLSLRGPYVEKLGPLRALENLRELDLSLTAVSDLEPLAGVRSLRSLNLYMTRVSDLSPLSSLTELRDLNLSDCRKVSDVGPLSRLGNLSTLNLSRCRLVSDVGPLSGLANLRNLELGTTGVSDLGALVGLTGLRTLSLYGCRGVRQFAPIQALLAQLDTLNIAHCQFDDLDPAVTGTSTSGATLSALRSHFADLERAGADDTVELKVFVLGNGGVGKTQLCRRLRNEPFDPSVPTTHGVQLGHLDLTIDGRKVRLNFWDFGGQDLYHGTHSLFVGGTGIFLLLWHPKREAGTDTEAGITIRRRPLSYWLDYVRGLAGKDMPTLVVQSQCESQSQRRPLPAPLPADFPHTEELQFAARNDWGRGELSKHLERAVRGLLSRHPAPPIGKNRVRVREALRAELEQPVAKRRRTLTQDEFKGVCDKAGGVASEAELLKYLHKCGVVFHRSGLFENRVIVDQSWALDAIYALFHRRAELQGVLHSGNGRFTRTSLAPVWGKYSRGEQELFLDMMESCGVCFRVRDLGTSSDHHYEYLAPEWFPEWAEVRDRVTGPLPTGRPGAQFDVHYTFLHDGILRTFLSRIGQRTGDNAIFWKYGCWFFDQESRSQVMIESRQGEDRAHPGAGVISFRAWGDEPETLVDALVAELQRIPVGVPPDIVRPGATRRPRTRREPDAAEALSTASPPVEPLADIRPGPLPLDANTSRQVFVSYAWGEDVTPEGREREAVVDQMCASLTGQGWDVVRDRQRMRNGDSIREFMLRIGRGQRVIVVLSEKYLRSPFCVNELHLIYSRACGEATEFQSRIIPVALSDAKYYDWKDRVGWAKHWESQHTEMEGNLKYLGTNDHRAYELCRVWQAVIATMLGYVADMLHPVGFDAIVANDFKAVREMLERAG